MTYLVLARKYRPQSFEEVIGQEHITTTLSNAIKTNRVAQAYLFAGPRGSGKTTCARILAKALNCEKGPTAQPCQKCNSCQEITLGSSLDVIEIDGASNNSVDDIRNLRENVRYAAAGGKYKVIIIDEVHMLSNSAFNALLKTLEEPPSHVIFVFATTEPQEVPETVLSRCQRFNFKRIALPDLLDTVKKIAQKEKIELEDEAAFVLAKRAEGSVRDMLSLLDQVVSFSGQKVSADLILQTLGLVDQEVFFQLNEAMVKKDAKAGITLIHQVIDSGADIKEFVIGLTEHFRNLLMAKISGQDSSFLPPVYAERYQKESGNFTPEDLIRMIKITTDLELALKTGEPKIHLELGILKLIKMDSTVLIEELLKKLENPSESNTKTKNLPTAEKSNTPLYENPTLLGTYEVETPEENPSAKLDLSLESLLKIWEKVIDKIKEQNAPLGTFLKEGEILELKGNILTIEFAKDRAFHKQQIEKRENLSLIEKTINEIYGQNLKLRLVLNANKVNHATHKEKKKVDLEELAKNEPLVKNILETFEGEIIQ